MAFSEIQKQVIKKCQSSVSFFIANFCKTKHPSAGIIPFRLFKYQKESLKAFRKHRFTIFRKCRQSGISSISGAFALWYAMFFNHKTILIVSRTDDDAMTFLNKNVTFLFRNLPQWMQKAWKPVKDSAHEFTLPNGSGIKSLTSHPDVLRSNASSLNIIDEAAFIMDMSTLWSAGYPTLQHGGSVIVVSTTAGVGGWYWSTWMDAEAKLNDFKPIMINWWDMDWSIEYPDSLTGELKRIAPVDGIRKCVTAEEVAKYGQYWSPWLESQWRGLQERGESWKFKQEVLADFVGSGNTILDDNVLAKMQLEVNDNYKRVIGNQPYVHPVKDQSTFVNFNGGDRELEPEEGLWVWKQPNMGTKPEFRNKVLVHPGRPEHRYVMGVDLATGKGRDYHAIEVFDVDELEQVAEMMIRCLPRDFKLIVDYIGRWYNNAKMVVERNNGGDAFIDELRLDLMYPNLWRKVELNDKPNMSGRGNKVKISEYGFSTGGTTKSVLNKALIDNFRMDNDGVIIYSKRLLKQFNIYVRKKDRAGHDTNKTEAEDGSGNFDDLVIASGLAMIGLPDALSFSGDTLLPGVPQLSDAMSTEDAMAGLANILKKNGSQVMVPFASVADEPIEESIQNEILKFATQLGALPMSVPLPASTHSKNPFQKR